RGNAGTPHVLRGGARHRGRTRAGREARRHAVDGPLRGAAGNRARPIQRPGGTHGRTGQGAGVGAGGNEGRSAPSRRPSAGGSGPYRLMARRWQVLLVTSVGVFMTFLDVTIVNIAFPDIRASFPDSSLAQLSWILNGYAIVFAAAIVPAGRL